MRTGCRLAVRLAYLGGAYSGWQRQANARTVQEAVEHALEKLYRSPIRITGAGRTDAGVHAAGQVAHFDAPLDIPARGVGAALNSLLPADIRVLAVKRVPRGFDARRDAVLKHYRYRIAWGHVPPPWEAQRAWVLPAALSVEEMRVAAACFAGVHDFRSFALAGHAGTGHRGTVRRVAAVTIAARGRRVAIDVLGDGFLRGMVRRMVGSLVEVGRGAAKVSWVAGLLAGTVSAPPAPTAPAHGLTLQRVRYR